MKKAILGVWCRIFAHKWQVRPGGGRLCLRCRTWTPFTFVLIVLGIVGCGGPEFQGAAVDSTLPDAGSSVPEVDARPTPLEASADMRAEGGSSGSVEATVDVAPETSPPGTPEAGEDARDVGVDAWPSDVVLEPWCPDSELYPAFSDTCYTWGQNHGWTLMGCCLPDHTCGTVWGTPRTCRK
jgi:hypothetical protein